MHEDHLSCPTHCCPIHGCKYGYEDCPVFTGVCSGVQCWDCEDMMDDYDEFVVTFQNSAHRYPERHVNYNTVFDLVNTPGTLVAKVEGLQSRPLFYRAAND
jgi:hypothetical protein